jgi:hypothetical protein
MPAERIPLPLVVRALRERRLTRQPPSYRQVYAAVIDGRVPAEQDISGRWTIGETDLPVVAAELCPDAVRKYIANRPPPDIKADERSAKLSAGPTARRATPPTGDASAN